MKRKVRSGNKNTGLNWRETWDFAFPQLCYFNILIPSLLREFVLLWLWEQQRFRQQRSRCCVFFLIFHVWTGSQEHLLVFHQHTQILAALVSLMSFNNVSRLEQWVPNSFYPVQVITAISLILIDIRIKPRGVYLEYKLEVNFPQLKQRIFKTKRLHWTRFSCSSGLRKRNKFSIWWCLTKCFW